MSRMSQLKYTQIKRREHDREAGVDRHHVRGIDDDRGEYLAHQRPDDSRGHAADERRAQFHASVRDEHVHEREDDGDDHIGQDCPRAGQAQASGGDGVEPLRDGLCSAEPSKPSATASRMGPTIMTLRYSVKRRAKLRGRSTRQTKLKLVSTF